MQIVKHISKYGGEPLFEGLLTVLNEYGEIRGACFVPTKAHSAFSTMLSSIHSSLKRFGHPDVELAYTDNMSDLSMLTRAFPELACDVAPITKFGQLPPAALPEDVEVVSVWTSQHLVAVIDSIRESLPINEPASQLCVGFDLEWNVGAKKGEQASVVIIAHNRRIYVVQVRNRLEACTASFTNLPCPA